MDTTVNFTPPFECSFLGRNGYSKQSGLNVYDSTRSRGHILEISPVTSKGIIGKCRIECPVQDLPKLIEALQNIVEHIKGSDSNPVKCNNCEWSGIDKDLIPFTDEDGPGKGCPHCKTDAYIADLL